MPKRFIQYCSCCGKLEHEVEKLVCKDNIYICNECFEEIKKLMS